MPQLHHRSSPNLRTLQAISTQIWGRAGSRGLDQHLKTALGSMVVQATKGGRTAFSLTLPMVLSLGLCACMPGDWPPGSGGADSKGEESPTPELPEGSGSSSTEGETTTSSSSSTGSTGTDDASSSTGGDGTSPDTTTGTGTGDSPDTTSTSGDETKSDTPEGEGSGDELDPNDPSLRVVVEDDVELCARCAGLISSFDRAFATQQRVRLRPGRFPMDAVQIAGEVDAGGTPYSFESDFLAMEVDKRVANSRLHAHGAGDALFPDGTLTRVILTLFNGFGDRKREFSLNDFTHFDERDIFRRFNLSSDDFLPALNGSKFRIFGACSMEGARRDTFRFELEGGHSIELTTDSRHFRYGTGRQAGQAIRAVGNFGDLEFDIDDTDDLLYCHPVVCPYLTLPDFAIRFPETDGYCGIGLRADRLEKNESLYTGELLDCDMKKKDSIDVVSVEIPPGFGL